jgi:cytochrome b561
MSTTAPGQIEPGYTPARKHLHWLSALIILWATFSGFGVALLAPEHPVRVWVETLNPQLTSLFIPFFLARLWLYLRDSRAGRQPLHNKPAAMVHGLLYLIILGVLITGVLMMTHPVTLLWIMTFPQLIHTSTVLASIHELHHVLCALLALLVALHLGAVALHAIRGQSVLHRMR